MNARLSRDDAGLSLTELLVTMLITSLVVIATMSLTIGFQRSNAENVLRQQQIDDGRFSAEVMSKSIRTAVRPLQIATSCTGPTCQEAFLSGTDYSISFFANLNNASNSVGPSKVTYTVPTAGAQAGQLIETVQKPDQSSPVGGAYAYCNATAPSATVECKERYSSRVLARGVLTVPGQPIFRFYKKNDPTPLNPAASGGTLTGAAMKDVVAVEFSIQVQTPGTHRADPTTYVQRVMLPNTEVVIRKDQTTP
ncbi:hypothetical protein ICW40_13705 [Actinotalea ferrariae]|uniref:PilW family protein n=1 Tax=Actinotalea ferrariae TaxID=1386098 RepID=UPI001C8C6FE6|nr:hypothetical protein [Actinotalea ferrariae]MBX9245858.1 hypothetical protein [Actinotalea ferrariae]